MKVALVCIAKNEDLYIDEWIDYHFKLGFDEIFVYQNNWRFNKDIENVTKIEFDGTQKQIESYNDFIKNHGNRFTWAAFLDVDEFLVLKKHSNIKDFINVYSNYDAIGINWVLFGDNNITELNDNYSVLERFTKRQHGVNEHIKTILKMKNNVKMFVHRPNVNLVSTDFTVFLNSLNPNGNDDIAQINHYFVKTKKEFLEKINRGRADINILRNISDFDIHNINDVDDFTALNFYKNDYNNLLNT